MTRLARLCIRFHILAASGALLALGGCGITSGQYLDFGRTQASFLLSSAVGQFVALVLRGA